VVTQGNGKEVTSEALRFTAKGWLDRSAEEGGSEAEKRYPPSLLSVIQGEGKIQCLTKVEPRGLADCSPETEPAARRG